MTTAPKITAIAPWLGSKRTMAEAIIDLLGPHSAYFEPFAGSLAVLLAKPPAQQETACDLHGDLTNLGFVLQDRVMAETLYDRLARSLFTETLLDRARAFLREHGELPPDHPADPERAFHYFVQAWAGRNGVAGSLRDSWQICVRWTPGGGAATTRFYNAVESIPAWHARLRHVVILRRDAFSVIEKIPHELKTKWGAAQQKIAVYLDPPYMHATRSGENNGGYRHDFTDYGGGILADDHDRLAEALSRFAGSRTTRVVVSYYDHPRLADLYPPPAWRIIGHTRHKHLHVQNKRGASRSEAPEVLIVNDGQGGPCA